MNLLSKFLAVVAPSALIAFCVATVTLDWCSNALAQTNLCESQFREYESNSAQLEMSWKQTAHDNQFMSFRSNAVHFWQWSKENAHLFISRKFMGQGVVVGDPHILNFADTVVANRSIFALVDVDDGGRGPLALDFIRFASASRLGPLHMGMRDLWSAYRKGLNGERIKKPHVLRRALEVSRSRFKNRTDRLIDRMTKGDQFAFGDVPLVRVEDAPVSAQQILDQAQVNLVAALNATYNQPRILDQGVRIKETGGSAGVPRFWFLIEDVGRVRHLIEFKLMPDPATTKYGPQLPHAQRIAEVSRYYRKNLEDEHFQVVAAGNMSFWMRPRTVGSIDFDTVPRTNEERREMREYLLYIANWMGRMQAKQANELAGAHEFVQAVQQDPETARTEMNAAVHAYVEESIRLYNSNRN